jgi:hypothetical protein
MKHVLISEHTDITHVVQWMSMKLGEPDQVSHIWQHVSPESHCWKNGHYWIQGSRWRACWETGHPPHQVILMSDQAQEIHVELQLTWGGCA